MGLQSLNIDIDNLIIEFQDIYDNPDKYNQLHSCPRKRIYDIKLYQVLILTGDKCYSFFYS